MDVHHAPRKRNDQSPSIELLRLRLLSSIMVPVIDDTTSSVSAVDHGIFRRSANDTSSSVAAIGAVTSSLPSPTMSGGILGSAEDADVQNEVHSRQMVLPPIHVLSGMEGPGLIM